MAKQKMLMETNITIRFVPAPDVGFSPADTASLEALNFHCEDIAEKLQAPMRALAIEMLVIKQEVYGESPVDKGESNAGS